MTHEFWDFIEKYLPDYHTRDDVIRQSELQQYIDGNDSSLADELEIGDAEDELHLILYNLYIEAIDAYTKGLGLECEECNLHNSNYCPVCGKKRKKVC